ncbi:hypothetical protein KI387_044148 [Taxus chinensis]|uniref:Uncharacterized protein n=1 Tax=Taxus chinensis TaxID=29808 RepID=A0AA38C6B2_TAXCH|nr:hypothetical protein KI387_044148 [Taxus chinensis]
MDISKSGEEEDSDPEWHDTQEILQVERAEQSVERVTLVSEELLLQDLGGEDESMVGCHVVPDVGRGHQSVALSVVGADHRDPSWRPVIQNSPLKVILITCKQLY